MRLRLLLHDIYAIDTGSFVDHARRGLPIVRSIISELGHFDSDESKNIETIVCHHSEKHILSEDPLKEFGKDIDTLDCLLYPDALDYYLNSKPIKHVSHYLRRARNVYQELGIAIDSRHLILEAFECGDPKLVAAIVADTPSWQAIEEN